MNDRDVANQITLTKQKNPCRENFYHEANFRSAFTGFAFLINLYLCTKFKIIKPNRSAFSGFAFLIKLVFYSQNLKSQSQL